jgi:protein-disulfide isomerase
MIAELFPQLPRRSLLLAGGALATAGILSRAAWADASPVPATSDPRLAERSIGKSDAPVMVIEFFSLTCPHCAAFARDTLPKVQSELVDPGKLKIVFWDFPLDKVALQASVIARALPADQYAPFTEALLASQARWAYARGVNTTEELWKTAALAGMARATFDAAIADKSLQDGILKLQDTAVKTYKVDSTPFFVFNGPGAKDLHESGEQTYDSFAAIVAKAAAA